MADSTKYKKRKSKTKIFTSNKCCCVPLCTSKTVKGEVSLHFFPREAELQQKWKSILRIAKPITKTMCVCSRHFKDSDFFPHPAANYGLKVNRRRLKPGVLPSLNIPSWRIETPNCDVNNCEDPGSQYMLEETSPDSDLNCSSQSRHSSDDEQTTAEPLFVNFPVDTEYVDGPTSGTSVSNSSNCSSDQLNVEDSETVPFKRRKTQSEEYMELIAMMKQLKEEISVRSTFQPQTSDEYYCISLSKRLSKLSACDNAFAKMRIEQVLFELECGDS